MNKAIIGIHLWTFLGAVILFFLLFIFKIDSLNLFSLLSYLIFYFIAMVTILIGYLTYRHPNKILFGNSVLAIMMLKLIATPFLIIWYIKTKDEISQLILLPFFFSYLWFTIAEMYYLLKKGKET